MPRDGSSSEDAAKSDRADTDSGGDRRAGVTRKRPWERPRIETGPLFESNSLACGKNSPNTDECLANPRMS
jgi:hypothetical protein